MPVGNTLRSAMEQNLFPTGVVSERSTFYIQRNTNVIMLIIYVSLISYIPQKC